MAKAKQHKRQHFVPQAYLKAWCDPDVPAGQEPYGWRFSKDGEVRRKAPDALRRSSGCAFPCDPQLDFRLLTARRPERDIALSS